MYIDENNKQVQGFGRIPGASKIAGAGLTQYQANNLGTAEFRIAQRQQSECGNRLMDPSNAPPGFARSSSEKLAFYNTRIPFLLRVLRGELSPAANQARERYRGCLNYIIMKMQESRTALQRQVESEQAKAAREGQRDAEILGKAIAESRRQMFERRKLLDTAKIAKANKPLLTSYSATSKADQLIKADPLSRFRKGASTRTAQSDYLGPINPLSPGASPVAKQEADRQPLRKQPRFRAESRSDLPALDLSPGSSTSDLVTNIARSGFSPRGSVRRSDPLMSEPSESEVPGISTTGFDCSGISQADMPVLVEQCRISMEGENGIYTSTLPPEEQPCNILMACGPQLPPVVQDQVVNAIIECGQSPEFGSPACDRLQAILNDVYVTGAQASFPIDPAPEESFPDGGMSIDPGPPSGGGGQAPPIVVPTPGEGGSGIAPGLVQAPAEKKDDKTVLYVGIGAAALVAVYLITQRRR